MSKPLTVTIPHSLGPAEARRRLDEGFAKIAAQFGENAKLAKDWNGDRMGFSVSALGQTITGHLDVLADSVRLEVVLPGILGLMAGKIRGKVETQGRLLLEKK